MTMDLATDQELVLLHDESVDRLAKMVIELTAELWVTKRRLALLEDAVVRDCSLTPLDERDVTEARAAAVPDLDSFVQRVFGALTEQ